MRWLLSLLWICSALAHGQWDSYGGPGGRQFTPLDQVTPDNVGSLENVWTYHTGDTGAGFARKGHSFQANPVLWDGRLYLVTSSNVALAVDARSGQEVWRHDAELSRTAGYSESAARGVSLWHAAELGEQACAHRVLLGTLDGRLQALDALTGTLCPDFGEAGTVDLGLDVGSAGEGDYAVTSPPAVIGDRLIVGSAIGDNRSVESELGIVRALDVRTGAELWRWDPIPRNADAPYADTWRGPQAHLTGAANAWAPLSVDAELGLVYVSTSSPSPDFFGGERIGDNRYANSIVALDVADGAVRWHYQLVHHDVWDYDTPSQPTLFSLKRDGQAIAAVAVITKTGMLYVFDRQSGQPLYPIEERPTPRSDVVGEQLAPTQPFSTLPTFSEHAPLTEDDAYGLVFFDRRACAKTIRTFRSEGVFTPPSLAGSIINPGYPGGANWGGVAIDEGRQIAVVNTNRFAVLVKLRPRDRYDAERDMWRADGWQVSRQSGTPYFMVRKVFLSPLGLPCTRPPWGQLAAMDLTAGEMLWQQPFGTIEDLAPAPVPNFNWGVPNMGGPLLTASGLIVIGAAGDFFLRALRTDDGTELWKARLPTSANATPMSYALDGKQYIVVAVGGHSGIGLPAGDSLMAFALSKVVP